jgi:hypothetical protein
MRSYAYYVWSIRSTRAICYVVMSVYKYMNEQTGFCTLGRLKCPLIFAGHTNCLVELLLSFIYSRRRTWIKLQCGVQEYS